MALVTHKHGVGGWTSVGLLTGCLKAFLEDEYAVDFLGAIFIEK